MVIKTDPRLPDGTPFPTTYWLTCKRLSSQIGTLEASGWMTTINQRLQTDPDFQQRLAVSTEALIEARDALDDLGQRDHPGGGPNRIKCVHAHVAHHLVTNDNPVGSQALQAIGWIEAGDPCV